MGAVLMSMTGPATAAWRGYISHPLGFAFAAPGDLKVEKGTWRGAVAGTRETICLSFRRHDIEYKVEVVDMRDIANDSATCLARSRTPSRRTGNC